MKPRPSHMSKRFRVNVALALFAFLFLRSTAMWAQDSGATIQGKLVNGSGTPVANAMVQWSAYFDTSLNSHGFTWNKGTITTIDYGNGYPNTYLAGINDPGVIVGGYGTNMTIGSIVYPWEHGFLYSSGTFSTFDAPFGDVQVTEPIGMNNKGQIVGGYADSQGMLYGFYAKATP